MWYALTHPHTSLLFSFFHFPLSFPSFTFRYGLRLELLAGFVIALVFFGVTILRNTEAALEPGLAGIALSFTAGVTSLLSFFAFLASETEVRVLHPFLLSSVYRLLFLSLPLFLSFPPLILTPFQLNSVERYYEYRRLAQENPTASDGFTPPDGWPGKGGVCSLFPFSLHIFTLFTSSPSSSLTARIQKFLFPISSGSSCFEGSHLLHCPSNEGNSPRVLSTFQLPSPSFLSSLFIFSFAHH